MWPKLRKRICKWRGILLTTPSVAGLIITAGSIGIFQLLEWATLDCFFRLRPLEPPDPRILIVTIDEPDIARVGKWPMSDQLLAQLIQNLKAQQPRVIGLDLYRDLPVQPGHQALLNVFESTPNLIGVEKLVGQKVAPPPGLKKLEQVGLADLILDADGKIRRGLISIRDDDGQTKLGLAAMLALMYLSDEGINLESVNAELKHFRLGKALFIPFAKNDGGYVNADAGGYQILLNYRGRQDNFYTISLTDVLDNRIPPDLVRDRIVLIGATGQSLNDLFLTPYVGEGFNPWKDVGKSPKRTPGVVIHANLTSQILSAALDGRPFIRVWNEKIEWLWILLWSFFGAGETWLLLQGNFLKNKVYLRWMIQAGCILLSVGILFGGSYLAFLWSWWIPVISPLAAFICSSIAFAVYYSHQLQRASQRRLIQFLEAMPVGVAVLDTKGQLCYANRVAQKLFGKNIIPHITPERLSETYQLYIAGTDILYPPEKSPILRALQGETSTADDIEIHLPEKIIPIESTATPIYDENGNIAYAIAAFHDITERKKAEEERTKFIDKISQINCDLENALEAEFKITDAYGRFVPHEFLYFLGYESIVDVKLGDCLQLEMSILFSDIRDFTSLSEMMTPEDNFKFINAYLSRMEPAITEHQGFIDKYIGDAIMALFSGEADNAVKAGIAMLKRLAEYNTTRGRPGRPIINIGIGINTGLMMLGTVGGQNRMNSTVISDAVNLASRIEGLTKDYGVSLLISHNTYLALNNVNDYAIRLIDRVKVKGKLEMVTVYEVFDADLPEVKEAKLKTKTIFEQAILLYNQKDFQKAAQLFEECLRQLPEDKVAHIYLERCHKHEQKNN